MWLDLYENKIMGYSSHLKEVYVKPKYLENLQW